MSVKKVFFGALVGAALLLGAGVTPSSAYVLGPSTPGKWGSPVIGTGATVSWSMMGAGINVTDDVKGITATRSTTALPSIFEAQLIRAFDAWAAVANITFNEVTDSGGAYNTSGQSGDIRIGMHAFDGTGGILAHGYYPPSNGVSAAGDIHFDSSENWVVGFGTGGYDIFRVAEHEIGHAIGLDHVAANVATAIMNPYYSEAFSALQPDDIAGAQYLYGPATVSAVPLPPALPLFGSAMAMMVFAGWRKKRRAA